MHKLILAALVLLVGCQKPAPAEAPSAPALASHDLTAMPGEQPAQAANALPPGHPAINGAAPSADGQNMPAGHPTVGEAEPAVPAAVPTGPASAGGLTWSDVAPLVRRAPKSNMRAAEYGIEGDPSAELTVFYFGEGAAGGVEANIERWLGQFTQPDGSDTAKKAKRSQIKVGSVTVDQVEVGGTYAGGMPGMPNAAAGPANDALLLGAIATGPKGAVFFKFTGARASLEKARGAFTKMLGSLHPEAPTTH